MGRLRAPVRRMRAAPVAAVLTLLLAACGSDGSGEVTAADPEPSLSGTSWVSTDVEGHELLSGTAISLSFSDGQIRASAGCNTFNGDYDLDGDRLLVPGGMAGTEMGCDPPERHDQDDWLVDLLVDGSAVEIGDRSLVLVGGDVEIRFVDESVVDPDRDLTGVTWRLETLIDRDTASTVPEGVEVPTLQVAEDGSAELFAGCNNATGTVTADGDTLELALVVTDMACPGEAGDVEEHVLEVLGGAAASFSIEGSTLTVSAGERGLEMRAE